ncbi:hypothetical protein NDGK_02203 [Clostridiales bacterium CHKCI001]|nr:hypothetical protein NDGK_02203 [Clostridiales bacterium CHKCI001]
MQPPILYRDRLIPKESVRLENDILLYQDNNIIITKWHALKPRKILSHGFSCYYLNKGYKISCFYNHENQLLYWYCDIISSDYNPNTNTYHFTDLLADVIIYPDGFVKVVDLEELSDALTQGLISVKQLQEALCQLSTLLDIIYRGDLPAETQKLREFLPV